MFLNREEAGEKLAQKLKIDLSPDVLAKATLLAVPRGGVVVGNIISRMLNLPFDCLITKKIPAPENEELAIGALGEGGEVVWEEELVKRLNVPLNYEQEIVKDKTDELEKKKKDFRGDKTLPELKDKVVIIVDDGVATGATVKVAIAVVRNFRPQEIILAVPVIAADTLSEIKKRADRVLYLEAPKMFFSVGQFYQDFKQIEDKEVRDLLKK